MNGQQGSGQPVQGSQESHLAYLLNSAASGGHGTAGLLGYPGALSAAQRLAFGGGDAASLEEQILQRASALRAEAFLQQHHQQQQQQQQQAQQRQHHLGAALAALQQQQQLAALGMNPNHLAGLSAQEQEILLGRAAALRELGGTGGIGMERLQQLEFGRLEELERRRQQFAALSGFAGVPTAPRPAEVTAAADKVHESVKSEGKSASKPTVTTSAQDIQKTKEDFRKTPGTVIVPCRARGMPMDHNFKTAYFVIAEDTKHGEDLVCSYYSCRNGGVKFRYCAHCMAPVAKRNFCRRHDHGISDKLPPQEDDDDDESMDDVKGAPCEEVPKKADPISSSLDILSKAASSSMAADPITAKAKPPVAPPKRKKPSLVVGVSEESYHDDGAEADLAHISKQRRKAWNALLVKRPRTKDPRHLSSWLSEVLAVSDFDTELEQNGSDALPSKSADEDPEAKSGPSSVQQDQQLATEKKKRKHSKDKPEAKTKKTTTDAKQKQKKVKQDQGATGKDPEASGVVVHNLGSAAVVESDKKEEDDPISADTKAVSDNGGPDNKPSMVDASAEKPTADSPEELEKSTEATSSEKMGEEDGFAGSFADWRDRKKDKLKKTSGSLKK